MKNTKIKPQEKARAYVRVSTLKDSQKDSPEHQESFIKEVAARDGVEIEYVYVDRDTGTSIVAREDVQNLIKEAKEGKFNRIYFAALSRFSRDTLDAISLKRILVNALGIRVVSIEDNYDSGIDDNEMLFGIISSVNQKQSENISVASKRGIRQSAMKGNFTGSIAPFGYRKVNIDGRKTLEVLPEQAAIVRLIYDSYVNGGMGEKAVTNHLNEMNVPSQKGGKWGVTSIQRILQNETYTGYVTFSKHENKQVYDDINDLQNRKKRLVVRDKSLWEKTDFQTHEPIITSELFEEAQRVREVRGGGKRGGQRVFVNAFAKMIFCRECGAAMVAMTSVGRNGTRYTYLMCSTRRRQGEAGCKSSTWIPYREFRDDLIAGIVERINKVIDMSSAATQAGKTATYDSADYSKDIKRLEKRVNDNRKLLFELRRLHMLQEMSDSQYNFEKEQYETEIAEAETQLMKLSKLASERQDRDKLIEDAKRALGQITSIEDYDDVERTRLALSKLIDRIEVSAESDVKVYSVLGQI